MSVAFEPPLRGTARPAPGATGALPRLGRFVAARARGVILAWIGLLVGLGALAPGVEHALSGAGWEASGSESVAARERIDAAFGGRGGPAEALTNAVKHADASRLTVRVDRDRDVLAVEVRDDGVGGATSLSSLRDRVEALGGRLLVGAGAGTRVRGELPCAS